MGATFIQTTTVTYYTTCTLLDREPKKIAITNRNEGTDKPFENLLLYINNENTSCK